MGLNFRRGFNRLFLVFAICWYLVAAAFLREAWNNYLKERREYAKVTSSPKKNDDWFAKNGIRTVDADGFVPITPTLPSPPLELTVFAVLAPVAVYLFGA